MQNDCFTDGLYLENVHLQVESPDMKKPVVLIKMKQDFIRKKVKNDYRVVIKSCPFHFFKKQPLLVHISINNSRTKKGNS